MQFSFFRRFAPIFAAPLKDPTASNPRPTRTELLSGAREVVKKYAIDGNPDPDMGKGPRDFGLTPIVWEDRVVNQIMKGLRAHKFGFALGLFQITPNFLIKSYDKSLNETAVAIRDDVDSSLPREEPKVG
jgi:hypothetical protein